MHGRKLYSVTKSTHLAGTYEAGINLNDMSRPLSSGVYFYKLTAEGVSISKKMVVAK